MNESIVIISLGWLGLTLLKELESKPFNVSGSYNSTPKGVSSEFQYDLNSQTKLPSQILNADTVFLNLPPSKIESLERLKGFLNQIRDKKVILISSTSVYGDQQGSVDESTVLEPTSKNGTFLMEAERFIVENFKRYIIIRPGGLYDEQTRHPGRSLSGKKGLRDGHSPVNLIGKKELIAIILRTLSLNRSLILNAVNSQHPSKKDYYSAYCIDQNIEPPHYEECEGPVGKTIQTIHQDFIITEPLP